MAQTTEPTTELQSTALVVAGSAMAVDDDLAGREARKLLKHAAAGGGLFPRDLTEVQAVQLARLSIAYGLDPYAEELIIYQSKPYLTLKGALRLANQHRAFEGLECTPATDAERKAFRCRDEEHLWKATVWRSDRRVPVVNYGRAHPGDGNPVSQKWAQEMAQKRAKHRALRDAFSMPLPGREADEESPQHWEHRGPVIEGEATELPEIRSDQIKAIHTIAGLLRWSDAEYRDVLAHTYRVSSSKDLTEGQAASFLEMLESLNGADEGRRFIEGVRARIA